MNNIGIYKNIPQAKPTPSFEEIKKDIKEEVRFWYGDDVADNVISEAFYDKEAEIKLQQMQWPTTFIVGGTKTAQFIKNKLDND